MIEHNSKYNSRRSGRMGSVLKTILILGAVGAIGAGCAKHENYQNPHGHAYEKKQSSILEQETAKIKMESLRLASFNEQLLAQKKEKKYTKAEELVGKGKIYSFGANEMDIRMALATFANKYDLNIIPDKDVTGTVTVSFSKLTLGQALDALLDANGYYFEKNGDIIRVRNMETKILEINYPRFVRGGESNVETFMQSSSSNSTNSTSNTSSTGSSSSGTDSGSGSSTSSVTKKDEIDFWGELSDNINKLMSKESVENGGHFTINRLAGTITITARHADIKKIEKMLNRIDDAIHRQVVIVAEIVELDKKDNSKMAIDWSRVTQRLSLNSAVASVTPFGVISGASSSSLLATYENNNKTFSAIIDALKEQGDVKVISKPQVRTINNQTAIIKVATDRTFFRVESTTANTTAGSTTQKNDIPQNVTVGLVMGITPQIGADGTVTLDISPTITSLSGTETSAAGSVAPIMDIKQVSSVVEVKSGQPVIIGGLIKQESSNSQRKVPGIGELPFVGGLFTGNYDTERSSELVIFITPYVI